MSKLLRNWSIGFQFDIAGFVTYPFKSFKVYVKGFLGTDSIFKIKVGMEVHLARAGLNQYYSRNWMNFFLLKSLMNLSLAGKTNTILSWSCWRLKARKQKLNLFSSKECNLIRAKPWINHGMSAFCAFSSFPELHRGGCNLRVGFLFFSPLKYFAFPPWHFLFLAIIGDDCVKMRHYNVPCL